VCSLSLVRARICRVLANCEYLQIDRALLNHSLRETQLILGCKGLGGDEFQLLECERHSADIFIAENSEGDCK
jgi:hypothetical protein